MHPYSPVILSIAPGRNRLGIAVFRHGNLVFYGGKSLRQHRSELEVFAAVERLIEGLIGSYRVTHLAIFELNEQQRRFAHLAALAEHILAVARRSGIPVHQYNSLFVRRQFCPGERATKANTAARLIEEYLELGKYLSRVSDWERRYYGYVFEAIALGKVCARQIDGDTRNIKNGEVKGNFLNQEKGSHDELD